MSKNSDNQAIKRILHTHFTPLRQISCPLLILYLMLIGVAPLLLASCGQTAQNTENMNSSSAAVEQTQSSLNEENTTDASETASSDAAASNTAGSQASSENSPDSSDAANYVPNTAVYPPEDRYKGWDPGYKCLYTEGSRERIWEEDVVDFANMLLSPYGGHIFLSDREFAINVTPLSKRIRPQTMNKFDPAKRQQFISLINRILREIAVRDDETVALMISESLTGIGDIHTAIRFPQENITYPFQFEILQDTSGELGVYCTATTEDYRDALGKKLLSINGIETDELVRRLERLCAFENPYLHERQLFTRSSPEYPVLKYLDIVQEEKAVFRFEDDIQLHVLPMREYPKDSIIRLWKGSDRLMKEKQNTHAFWHRVIDEDRIIYARISKFLFFGEYEVFADGLSLSDQKLASWDVDHLNIHEFFEELAQLCEEKGEDYKLVIDLRSNPGGHPWPELKSLKRLRDVNNRVYLFIDENSASCSCFTAFGIKEYVPNTTIVGSPTAQPVNFPLGSNYQANFRIIRPDYFRYSSTYFYLDGEDSRDAVIPDVGLYQTREDFMAHLDTLYEWVKRQP